MMARQFDFIHWVLFDFGIQLSMGLFAIMFQTEIFYDLTGSLTFLAIITYSYWSIPLDERSYHHSVQTLCVALWACRLGVFLFSRIMKSKTDKRFDKVRTKPLKFAFFWFMQGVWVLLTILPSLLLNISSANDGSLQLTDFLGWGLFSFGCLFEWTADWQKLKFNALISNKGKFINVGLWKISRHPNYLGEIMVWSGLGLAAWSELPGYMKLACIVSPLFVSLLLIKLSGIPPLEHSAKKKWGDTPEYKEYIRRVPVLIPFSNFC